MSPYEELRLLLGTLAEGEQRASEVCPFCRGGRSGERTLSIIRFGGLDGTYICHRGQCGKEGYVGERHGTHYTPPHRTKEFTPRIFDGIVEEVPDEIRNRFIETYGWSADEFRETGCGWSPEYNRTVWQVRSPTGAVRGIELRSHDPQSRTKTLHYRHSSDVWAGYCGTNGGNQEAGSSGAGGRSGGSSGIESSCLVAVEDLLSAYKVSRTFPAVSIMGSHLTVETLIDLMKVSQNIVLCLDRDATAKAEKFAKRFAFICPGLVHVPLQRDLKYETDQQIKEIIGASL